LRLISYPVYLVHQPVQTIAEAAFRGQAAWVVGSVAFVAALILASLLHVAIEKSAIRLGRRLMVRTRATIDSASGNQWLAYGDST
jgi:peptidoglycan/LPS O-acetylase OafA/YrhL